MALLNSDCRCFVVSLFVVLSPLPAFSRRGRRRAVALQSSVATESKKRCRSTVPLLLLEVPTLLGCRKQLTALAAVAGLSPSRLKNSAVG